jgi:hypothetical protein
MNVNLGFSDVTKKYNTCILFIPSEVTMELVNTIADKGMSIKAHGIGTPVIIRVKAHVEYGLE